MNIILCYICFLWCQSTNIHTRYFGSGELKSDLHINLPEKQKYQE